MTRILIVNVIAAGRSGTEIVTYETAQGLRNRGHEVAVFTRELGMLGHTLASDGIAVVEDTASVPWVPDIIQANHTYPLIEAHARFPEVPVLCICHDAFVWYNEPVALPAILKYAAVSVACRDRVVRRFPQLADNVELLHNAVDLDAFKIRPALPSNPRRALILTHDQAHITAIRAAGRRMGFSVHALGRGVGKVVADLPARLVEYDLVFTTGRMALEALAVGCAVIVVGERGLAGMVTTDVVSSWRDHNFGFALLTRPVSVHSMMNEVHRYNPADSARVSEFVRRHCSLSLYLDRLEAIYRDMLVKSSLTPEDRSTAMIQLAEAFRSLVTAFQRQKQTEIIRTAGQRLKHLFSRWLRSIAKRMPGHRGPRRR
jgi:hypothetical protein